MTRSAHPTLIAFIAALLIAASGCTVAPRYVRPDVDTAQAFKEGGAWAAAAPADTLDRGAWWTLFGDAQLDALARRVTVSNQNIAAAQASYAQARALVREQRAGLFPVITLDGSATRSDSSSSDNSARDTKPRNSYRASVGASWEPDVWGRLRLLADNAQANAQASAADLASATLSAQGELVLNYLSLRETDAEIGLLMETVDGYQRALDIANNRYKVGVAPRTDLLSAQTQLYGTQADLEGLSQQRAQLEHAIAVLLGESPGNFRLEPAPWKAVVPAVPIGVPSALLQRRPDIAASERRVAAANAQIGISRSAYFPSFSLSASYGSSSSALRDLFSASSLLWSIGASVTQTLLDFGAREARLEQSRAAYDAAVANYRQTALTAFADVEDQLSSAQVLERQYGLRGQQSAVADENERLILNRYRAGQVSYTEVVTAQASALSSRRSLIQAGLSRQTTAAALIQALGGGWNDAE